MKFIKLWLGSKWGKKLCMLTEDIYIRLGRNTVIGFIHKTLVRQKIKFFFHKSAIRLIIIVYILEVISIFELGK